MKTMKKIDHILDIKVEKVEEGIRILQKAYTAQMLEKFGMLEYKSQIILLLVVILLSVTNGPKIQEEIKEIKEDIIL